MTNSKKFGIGCLIMKLSEATEGKEYIIKDILVDDEEVTSFLFSLGCYSGEAVTVISRLRGSYVVSIKEGRYSFDNQLAEFIEVE